MLGSHIETIVAVIYKTEDKNRRVSLLKELIHMILEVSVQIGGNVELIKQMFEIAKNQKSDESMIENILWMATSMSIQNQFHEVFGTIVENMMGNQIILIIWKALSSTQERIILQALKLITSLCSHDKFRSQLYLQPEVLQQILQISKSIDKYRHYKIEIQTALCECLN